MTKREAAKLRLGLYRIFWKEGGRSSVASVGVTYDGTRWFAPANWTAASTDNPLIASTKWRMVERVTFLKPE